jgi:hypothetical protein
LASTSAVLVVVASEVVAVAVFFFPLLPHAAAMVTAAATRTIADLRAFIVPASRLVVIHSIGLPATMVRLGKPNGAAVKWFDDHRLATDSVPMMTRPGNLIVRENVSADPAAALTDLARAGTTFSAVASLGGAVATFLTPATGRLARLMPAGAGAGCTCARPTGVDNPYRVSGSGRMLGFGRRPGSS